MIQAVEAEVPGWCTEGGRKEEEGGTLVPRCPPQISHGLTWDQNRDSNLKMKINSNYFFFQNSVVSHNTDNRSVLTKDQSVLTRDQSDNTLQGNTRYLF
jgi:hypothetical protein